MTNDQRVGTVWVPGGKHINALDDVMLFLLKPTLYLHDGEEKPKIGMKRVVVFLCFQRRRYSIFRYDMEVDMSAIPWQSVSNIYWG